MNEQSQTPVDNHNVEDDGNQADLSNRKNSFESKNRINASLISKFVAVMSVVFSIALVFASGLIPIPFGFGFSKPPVTLESGDVPCLPVENMKPVDLKEIKVNILNSTNTVGLAGNVAKELKKHNVNVALVGNTERAIETEVNIRTNSKNIVKAYTLARMFQGAKITYSPSLNNIEVILGESFSGLLKESQIKRILKQPLVSAKKCILNEQV